MLSYQIREYYEFASKELSEFEKSIEVLLNYEQDYQKIALNTLTEILALARVTKEPNSAKYRYVLNNGELINIFNSINDNFTSAFEFGNAFEKIAIYKNNIKIYKQKNGISNTETDKLFAHIDELLKNFQEYSRSKYKNSKAVILMQNLFNFRGYLEATKSFYSNIINMFNSGVDEDIDHEDGSVFEIQLLDVEFTFEEFVSHLGSIQKIYNELGGIIYQNTATPPLKIVKIESGSLLAKILGDKNILDTINLFLKKTINLIFSRTREGKITTHSKIRDELLKDVEIIGILTDSGYETDELKEIILNSFILSAKELEKICASTSSFKINNEVIKYSDSPIDNKKYLETGKIKQLPDNSDSHEGAELVRAN
ncbi:MAG: hypothetical protein FWH20_05150 [Oscillospiraceae bacterium]|nr:hypothetical protein [Oscillospiraceae bacterium]